MLVRKGFVEKEKVWNFVKSYESKLVNEKWNGKENNSDRKCLWFGVGVELGFNCSIFKGEEISNRLRLKCNELWDGEDWNSILLYRYSVGCELKDHVDRNIFGNKLSFKN